MPHSLLRRESLTQRAAGQAQHSDRARAGRDGARPGVVGDRDHTLRVLANTELDLGDAVGGKPEQLGGVAGTGIGRDEQLALRARDSAAIASSRVATVVDGFDADAVGAGNDPSGPSAGERREVDS